MWVRFLVLWALSMALSAVAQAQASKPAPPRPVSYSREIVPIFRTACLGCHGPPTPSAGFSVESYEAVMKGGNAGVAVVPGKAAESRLLHLVDGSKKPQMPPGGSLKPADVDTIRRWIDAGARSDVAVAANNAKAGGGLASAPSANAVYRPLGTLRATPAPVNAIAFSPDGKTLAVGTYRRVLLCDAATGAVGTVWAGHADAVRSLVFSPDGKLLAAGGGAPGAFGDIRIWSVAAAKELRAFGDHTDAVHGIAFRPDGAQIASASGDKTVKVWETATGKLLQTLRDHSDAVLAVAFHPEGKYLATAGADKAVKVWQLETGRRIYAIGASDEPVTDVAFSPSGAQLITTSTDRRARVWNFGPETSGHVRDLGSGGEVWSVEVTRDGKLCATASADGRVRLWDMGNGANTATLEDAKEWLYAVRFSPDGTRIAAGTWDGRALVWDVATKKLLYTIPTVPIPPTRETGGQ